MGKFKQNSNDIVIDDGSKLFNIKNKRGKVLAQFVFRPSDTNIVNRYEEVKKFFENFKVPEGAETKDIENMFVEKMDYLVGADSSLETSFFSIMGPMSIMANGKMFVEECMEAICNVINSELDVRLSKMRSRVGKYTAKYHG